MFGSNPEQLRSLATWLLEQEVEILLDPVLVGEHPPHRLGREDVAKDGGVDGSRGHPRAFRASVKTRRRDQQVRRLTA